MIVPAACAAVLVLLNSAFLAGYALGQRDANGTVTLNETVR